MANPRKQIGSFEKYLTIWVALCIAAGILIGSFAGEAMLTLSKMEIYRVNISIAILIWLMIYPMMLQIDFSSLKNVGKRPKGTGGIGKQVEILITTHNLFRGSGCAIPIITTVLNYNTPLKNELNV